MKLNDQPAFLYFDRFKGVWCLNVASSTSEVQAVLNASLEVKLATAKALPMLLHAMLEAQIEFHNRLSDAASDLEAVARSLGLESKEGE